jgi:hypothetical protein
MDREQRIADLKAKLKAREGRPGFKVNCEEIRAQIAALEAEAS